MLGKILICLTIAHFGGLCKTLAFQRFSLLAVDVSRNLRITASRLGDMEVALLESELTRRGRKEAENRARCPLGLFVETNIGDRGIFDFSRGSVTLKQTDKSQALTETRNRV